MQSPAEFASYLGYSVGWRAVRTMPARVAYGTFARLADQLWRRQGRGVRQLQRNLARVVPEADEAELRDLSREGMQSYFRYWCDVFRLPDWSPEHIVDTFDFPRWDMVQQAKDEGRGVIVALPHAGNWDHAGAFAAVTYGGVVSVAENLKPERLTHKFLQFRESLGMYIVTLRPGEDVYAQLVEYLEAGEVVALLGDRDLTASGVPVEFFGEATRMPAGPAALAHETGAPLYVASLGYEGPYATVALSDRLEVPTGGDHHEAVRVTTQRIADEFAAGIARDPVDWHMLQPLWLSDLDASRLRVSRYE